MSGSSIDEFSLSGAKATKIDDSTFVLRGVKPGDARNDLRLTAVSDPVLDSSRSLTNYYKCGGRSVEATA